MNIIPVLLKGMQPEVLKLFWGIPGGSVIRTRCFPPCVWVQALVQKNNIQEVPLRSRGKNHL